MKTVIVNDKQVQRNWLVIDAKDQVLGRLATRIAHLLKGKHKTSYSDSVDVGDYVVVVNADKIVLTGKKADVKRYFRHNTRPGGWVHEPFRHALARDGRIPVELAVKGMLPHNKLGRRMFSKLFVYAEANHPHAAQKPQAVAL
jgi:large subunit ribosomal protein L13